MILLCVVNLVLMLLVDGFIAVTLFQLVNFISRSFHLSKRKAYAILIILLTYSVLLDVVVMFEPIVFYRFIADS